jgi:hypothetical protein
MLKLKAFIYITCVFSFIASQEMLSTTDNNSLKPFNDNSYIFSWDIDEMEGLINITIK